MVKPKPPRGHVEARLEDPLLIEGSDSHSAALHKVTETLAAHSVQIDKRYALAGQKKKPKRPFTYAGRALSRESKRPAIARTTLEGPRSERSDKVIKNGNLRAYSWATTFRPRGPHWRYECLEVLYDAVSQIAKALRREVASRSSGVMPFLPISCSREPCHIIYVPYLSPYRER
ncbi:hypothetical protein NDU88_006210 [Pleurodeles waltl]|uniref:Uncharacterized protein n=1 Tax=Pleurodeles waltl TaxID=8319 RepID=A0AAV7LNS0_PLEWA|nr:hypothetical protein NDU88_006210 [Pleurodeles waltl]